MSDIKPKLSKEEQKEASLATQEANEKVHKLVVKIISWKAGLLDGALITRDNKISPKEWNSYRKHILKISKTESSDIVNRKLREAEQAIKQNGGFE